MLEISRLYLILDRQLIANKSLADIGRQLINSGIDIVQLRDKQSPKKALLKDASFLSRLLANTKSIFIVNDYLDIALAVNSDGIHLGQDDGSIKSVRKMLGKDKIIGASCHTLKQALIAQDNGADYLGIGPMFASPLKPNSKAIGLSLVDELNKRVNIPFFAIGDINLNNLSLILASGIKRVAVCRAILNAKDLPKAIKSFVKAVH